MFQKIKLYLLIILLTRKKMVLLAVLLVLGGLFTGSQSVRAFFDIPYNIASMQLDSLDFIDNSILRMLVLLALLIIESATFLFISANLLDWASSLPIDIGESNKLVQAGWDFTSGLVSLTFILIFIAIALSYIFKMETFAMKKTLPRLIIVALLINFSLLFVQMAADVGWIFQNSFKTAMFGAGGLAAAAMEPLKSSALSTAGLIVTTLVGYTTLSLIPVPFLSVGGLFAMFSAVLVGEVAFGMVSQSIILIAFNFTAGLIFLTYTALFLARIGVVWLLAITAPLAFAAAILPQTEKYFKQWLNALIQWIFLGIVAFFLMGLGIKLFGEFSAGSMEPIQAGGWKFLSNYYKYIFLFVYLIVAFSASRKFAPMGTEAISNFVNKAATTGAKFTAERTRKWGTGLEVKRLEAGQRAQERLDRGESLSWQQRAIARPFAGRGKPMAEAKLMALKGGRVQEEANKLSAKTKGMDDETAKSALLAEAAKHGASRIRNKNKTQALVEELARRGASVDPELYKEAVRNAGPIPEKPEDFAKNRVQRVVLPRMPHLAENEAQIKAVIDKMSASDIEKLDSAAKANVDVAKHIIATMRSDLISRLAAQGGKAMENAQKQIEEQLGKKWETVPDTLTQKELSTLRKLHASSAFANFELALPGSLSEIEDRLKNFGKPAKSSKPPEEEPPKLYSTSGKKLI